MKITLLILGALGALIATVFLIGALLPRHHRVAREANLAASPLEVYALLRDFASAPGWRSSLVRVELLDPADGRLRFREISKDGTVTYELEEDVPGQKLVTRIVDRDLGYSGSWTYELLPTGSGTQLRITEDGDVSNILFRFFARFVFGHTSTMENYLADLSAKVATGDARNRPS